MSKPDEPAGRYVAGPNPPTASEREGAEWGRSLARRHLPNVAQLAASIAFGDAPTSTWTRLSAAKLLASIAGLPEMLPEASQPDDDDRRSRLAP